MVAEFVVNLLSKYPHTETQMPKTVVVNTASEVAM